MRKVFCLVSSLMLVVIIGIGFFWPPILWTLLLVVPLIGVGVHDMLQTRRAVLKNFPIIGHGRYLLEMIRPEINQYFIESNTDGTPFNREFRSVVYQRAKGQLDTQPFGTQWDVYSVGYEWINHSLAARLAPEAGRVTVGAGRCAQPYDASLLNISAMSFGSLSSNAIRALNRGAKIGDFALNTGEGGISPHHLEGGDLIWQIGTGYFGCRDGDGRFSRDEFQKRARLEAVKMIEVKLSQGAKPGHGGILPARKVTPEIAEIRGVALGQDVLSPPAHSAFGSPMEMLELLAELRELSGGKPVGFKLCVGDPAEFLALCKVMERTQLVPDFIAVDGGEGGTGAAPLEFSNSVGTPLTEGLIFVHNALTGFSLRDEIKLIASGKIITGFHMVKRLAVGADLCSSARGMMMALGCIQARRCNSNVCPVGVATQDPGLVAGLVVADKDRRVAQFHKETVESVYEILGAAGLSAPEELKPSHIRRRVGPVDVRSYAEIYDYLEPGALLSPSVPETFQSALQASSNVSFR